MQLTEGEAKLIAGYILADYRHELATTRKVLQAIPDGRETYCPDERSMNTLKLAWHVASADKFFLDSVLAGAFAPGEGKLPESIKRAADVIAWHDANIPAALDAVGAMPGSALAADVDFFGMMKTQAVNYLMLMAKHAIHHRGQLSAYLRPMGAKVPGIYGPSGDTPVPAK